VWHLDASSRLATITRTHPPPSPQIFGTCLLRPNVWMDEGGTWHGDRPQPRRLCVRWDPVPFPKRGWSPPSQFSAHFYCGQTARCIKMPHGMDVGLSPGDFVLYGDPVLPPQQRGRSPFQFSAHFYCAQTAGCIKMPLGMEVDGDPAPLPKKGRSPLPNFKGLG